MLVPAFSVISSQCFVFGLWSVIVTFPGHIYCFLGKGKCTNTCEDPESYVRGVQLNLLVDDNEGREEWIQNSIKSGVSSNGGSLAG